MTAVDASEPDEQAAAERPGRQESSHPKPAGDPIRGY
jgi:hypothetical protein